MIGHLTQDQLEQEFQAFCDGDAEPRDLFARYLVMVSVGIALWASTDQVVMLVWGVGYVGINIFYARFLSRAISTATHADSPGAAIRGLEAVDEYSATRAISARELRIAMCGSVFVALWYTVMVLYVATLDGGAYLLLATCGAVGAALHCLARNTAFSYSAYVDFFAAMFIGVGVFTIAGLLSVSLWIGVATFLGGACVMGYFWLCFRQVIADRQQLKEKMLAEVQDQKMRALGQLTSGVAHDFNNLLAIVSGNLELSLEQPKDSRDERYLVDAQKAVASGAALVKQLMAYSRSSHLQISNLVLPDFFDELASVLARVIPATIDLKIDVVGPACQIQCDPSMLKSAILNLVINSRDAINPGMGEIRITVAANHEANQVVIKISDSGPGMRANVLERAFEPFFTTKGVGEGSGLGLCMVKGFAEQMGGMVEVQNGDESGLNVWIRLPMSTKYVLPLGQVG